MGAAWFQKRFSSEPATPTILACRVGLSTNAGLTDEGWMLRRGDDRAVKLENSVRFGTDGLLRDLYVPAVSRPTRVGDD